MTLATTKVAEIVQRKDLLNKDIQLAVKEAKFFTVSKGNLKYEAEKLRSKEEKLRIEADMLAEKREMVSQAEREAVKKESAALDRAEKLRIQSKKEEEELNEANYLQQQLTFEHEKVCQEQFANDELERKAIDSRQACLEAKERQCAQELAHFRALKEEQEENARRREMGLNQR